METPIFIDITIKSLVLKVESDLLFRVEWQRNDKKASSNPKLLPSKAEVSRVLIEERF